MGDTRDTREVPVPEPYRVNGGTGPRGEKMADWEHPVFDGPQPRTGYVPVTKPNDLNLNTENAGE